MAHPKRKISKMRRDLRRTHYKLTAPNVQKCNNCGEPVIPHHVCGSCGFYRGQLAIDMANNK